jgi:NhaA family Na+:H+ antiporter
LASNLKQFAEFIRSYATGGGILIACVVVSLVIANTGLHNSFNNILDTPIGAYTSLTWINDGLMAIFFLLVGLEIKDEVLNGELSDGNRPPCLYLQPLEACWFPRASTRW